MRCSDDAQLATCRAAPASSKAIDGLPTLPVVALQIGEVIHSKNVSVNQIAELLQRDPSTSAKLLRLVNSPYFGIPGGVSDVARAIPFVGFNTLYQLVLGISVLEALNVPGGARSLWMHSLTVATAAKELATELRVRRRGRVLHRRPAPRHGQDRAREDRAGPVRRGVRAR